jgi:hypothetical protein
LRLEAALCGYGTYLLIFISGLCGHQPDDLSSGDGAENETVRWLGFYLSLIHCPFTKPSGAAFKP